MDLHLEEEIVMAINRNCITCLLDLPYVLRTEELQSLMSLVDSAPTAYKLTLEPSTVFTDGTFVIITNLEYE